MNGRAKDNTRNVDEGADRQTDAVVSRRDTLKLTGAIGTATLGGFGTGVGSAETSAWTLVAIPDTQKYAQSSSLISYAQDQMNWIANNLSAENIAFVSHEGDWVDDGSNTTEWERMDDAWNTIEGDVPYAATIGDHDYAVEEDRSSGAANYRSYFGESRYQDYSWFGGSAPNDLSHYQRFSAGGYEFLHIDLEWEAPGDSSDSSSPVGWAQSVLDANPDTPTIITTHSYLWDQPNEEGRTTFVEENNRNGNSGEQLFQKLVEPNPQVFMTLNGNFHEATGNDDGEWAQVSQNSTGLDVYEMLACYSDYSNGGNGLLRRIRFVPDGGSGGQDRIEVRTYSPSLDEFKIDNRSQFNFDLSFANRFSSSSGGGSGGTDTETVTFQQGVGGYAGTTDTYLQKDQPGADNGAATELNVDTSDPHGSGKDVHALVRFENIVGGNSGQVPSGADVTSATLTLETTGKGDGATLHRMLMGWSENASWDSLVGGVQADGSEAASSADVTTGTVSTGPTTIDVTDSVQAWVNGDSSYGWAFLPSGGNGWDFYSSEGATPPELTVTFGSSSGDSGSPPNVSWVNPSSSDTVSGTTTVQINASDAEDSDDSLTVEYSVDDDSWTPATYNSTSGYYEDSWDSTSVSDGDLTLDARAIDSANDTTTATITVTTDNTGTETVTFQQGVSGYAGTADTYLQEDQPGADNGAVTELNVDTSDPHGSGKDVHALVRFENIVGSNSGQVPSGVNVMSATLTLETTGKGDGAALHRMLTGWSESASWDSFGGGVQADGSEAASSADTTTGAVSTGPTALNVTDSVQAWVNGDSNYGWAFLPSGGNGWDFYAAEGATPPELTVTFDSS